MSTGFNLAGTDLRTLAINIATVDGWDSYPGLKRNDYEHTYMHGVKLGTRHFYESRNITLSMLILGSTTAEVETNMQTVLGLLHASSGTITLIKTLPDATTRSIEVIVQGAFPIQQQSGISRKMILQLLAPYPFYHHTPISNNPGLTGSFNLTNLGNAPINDMVVTFGGVGRLTNNTTGDWIDTDLTAVVADVGARTAKVGSVFKDNNFTFNTPWWMQMEPGINSFTATTTVAVNFYHGSLS